MLSLLVDEFKAAVAPFVCIGFGDKNSNLHRYSSRLGHTKEAILFLNNLRTKNTINP